MSGTEPVQKDMSQELALAHEVARELMRARSLHSPQHGPHEGYAVILEELDELWDEVRKKQPDLAAMREECIQIAAMAMRFVLDVCEKHIGDP